MNLGAPRAAFARGVFDFAFGRVAQRFEAEEICAVGFDFRGAAPFGFKGAGFGSSPKYSNPLSAVGPDIGH